MECPFAISLMLGRAFACAYYWRTRHDSGLAGPNAARNALDRVQPRLLLPGPVVWVHTSGPGDAHAGAALCDRLTTRMPDAAFYVTCNTRGGEEVLRDRLRHLARPWELHWLPFDSKLVIRRLLRRLNPSVFIGMQGELWPVLFRELRRRGVATVVLRSDLFDWDTQREFPQVILPLYRDMLSCVDLLSVRAPFYRPRAEKLGVEASRIHVGGDYRAGLLKPAGGEEDAARFAALFQASEQRPLVVLSGLRQDEFEELAHLVDSDFGETSPRFLLAPVEKEVLRAHLSFLRKNRIEFALRSGLRGAGHVPRVVVLDTSGELVGIYGAAAAAVIGDTFPPTFSEGRNYWEPLARGTPVIVGPGFPHREAVLAFSEVRGCRMARDAAAVKDDIAAILAAPDSRAAIRARAEAMLQGMPDAAAMDAEAVVSFLARRRSCRA